MTPLRQRMIGDMQLRNFAEGTATELLPNPRRDWRDLYLALTGRPLDRCPHCLIGVLVVLQVLPPAPYSRPALEDST